MNSDAAGDQVVAAVDIGTNSARLLIARRGADGVETLGRHLRLVRLGQGVDRSGRLAPAAIQRTAAAVVEFARLWRSAGADRVRITTTSAARDARNVDELATAVHEASGVTLEVISGEEEGWLAFRGATAGLADLALGSSAGDPGDAAGGDGPEESSPAAVLDIGGGSTEMIVGRLVPDVWTSRQMGSVRVTEQVLTDDPPTPAQIRRAEKVIDIELDAIAAQAPPAPGSRLIAVAGTATTLAAIQLGAETYPEGEIDGMVLTVEEVGRITDRLLSSSAEEIARAGGVQTGREDVIAGGALILHRTMLRFGFDAVTISESDSLDALAVGLLEGAASQPGPSDAQSADVDRVAAAASELVEVVEPDGTVVEVITRAEMRRRGARHRCTYVAVVRSNGDVVVHKRAAWKDVSPSTWDLAFGGVCDVGEGWLVSATRELAEEAGVTGVELIDLGGSHFEGEGVALIGRVYVAPYDGPVTPDDGEVVALDEVPIGQLTEWIERNPMIEDSPVVVPPLLLEWWARRAR